MFDWKYFQTFLSYKKWKQNIDDFSHKHFFEKIEFVDSVRKRSQLPVRSTLLCIFR